MSTKSRKLILASASPQRRTLLEQAGYELQIVPPRVEAECGVCSRETPPEYVARLAYQKGADVAERVAAGMVVACDTVVECAGQILGKPADLQHARRMLELLSGHEHHVYSGLCVWPRPHGQPHVRVAVTTLSMKPLSDADIQQYLASGLWEGKAGALGLQDRPLWLRIVSGSESNVIGLPLELLSQMLRDLGEQETSER
jgi:septum formation protein